MRNVIVQEFVTLDGYTCGPNGELDFIADSTDVSPTAGETVEAQLGFIETIDTILLGAVTYRMFAGYWPQQTSETELIADALNSTPKVVFSQTLDRAPWGGWEEARVVAGSATEEVRRLKQVEGKDMVVWGSLSVAQSLARDGLVDEYRLWLCPIVLGAGKRLFAEGINTRAMTWLETKPYKGGIVSLRFRPNDA